MCMYMYMCVYVYMCMYVYIYILYAGLHLGNSVSGGGGGGGGRWRSQYLPM